jgi:hypothetical protein
MDAMNDRRLRCLHEHGHISALETALRQKNRGTGLGIRIIGVVVDKNKLKQVAAFVCTVLPTLVTALKHYSKEAALATSESS